jgi:hypothetical protein
MKAVDGRSITLARCARLDEDDGEQIAGRIAGYVIERAIAGQFGFFKLWFDMVDGKLHQSAETERTLETECVLAGVLDAQTAELGRAA